MQEQLREIILSIVLGEIGCNLSDYYKFLIRTVERIVQKRLAKPVYAAQMAAQLLN